MQASLSLAAAGSEKEKRKGRALQSRRSSREASMDGKGENNVQHPPRSKRNLPIFDLFRDARHVFRMDELGREILGIAFPAILALVANRATSFIDTAFIHRLGDVQLKAVGASNLIFSQVVNTSTFILSSVTASLVAEEKTLMKTSADLAEDESIKKCPTMEIEMKELTHNDGMLDCLGRGSEGDLSMKRYGQDSFHEQSQSPEPSPYLTSGLMELAAIGVSIPLPLVSITTSSVAEEETAEEICADLTEDENIEIEELTPDDEMVPAKATTNIKERQRTLFTSTALLVAGILGVFLALFLAFGANNLLAAFANEHSDSPSLSYAKRYLGLKSIGAPAILLSSAMQGVLRGLKDTRTPLCATVAGGLANIGLDVALIFVRHWGVSGAAIAHALSQYIISLILLWRLTKQVDFSPPRLKDVQFLQFLKRGFLVLTRLMMLAPSTVIAASLAAELDKAAGKAAKPDKAATAFRKCSQVWTTSSYVANGLAVAGQAILADAFAKKDYGKATAAASRVIQMGFFIGLALAMIVGVALRFESKLFSKDISIQHLIFVGSPFVATTQAISSLAFVSEGITFGASDFAYSAYSMVLVPIISIPSLYLLYKSNGFIGIWVSLIIFMGVRTLADIGRMGSGTGPWLFLRERRLPRHL